MVKKKGKEVGGKTIWVSEKRVICLVRATEYIIRQTLLAFKASGVHEIPHFDQDSLVSKRDEVRERERERGIHLMMLIGQ